ncbi:Serine/arginine-rich splicing factor 9 (Splicing factor [Durusdinium trenchii]|uniref:Arginine/serine-rich 9 n=1 Tax=Durusdinium trenchii TaxID=1381693 RepID=A0ABP0KZ69_9DINO
MGWGNGKGGYGWGYPPMMMMMPWGKGKGKGLRGFANEKKVWIGGLPAGPTSIETNKKLKEHMSQAGECIFAEINKNGIAGAAFKTPEEVQKAVESLNGSIFEGHTLEVDIWQKKTPETAQS